MRARVISDLNRQADLVRAGEANDLVTTLSVVPRAMVFTHRNFLDSFWRTFLLPFAAVFSIFSALVAWRFAKLNHYKGQPLASAIIETVSAAALFAVSVGAFAAAGLFVTIGPAVLAATLAMKVLFDAGSSIYFAVKAFQATDLLMKQEYRSAARHSLIYAVTGTVVVAALGLATLMAGPIAFAVGLTSFLAASIVALITTYHAQAMRVVKRDRLHAEALSAPVVQNAGDVNVLSTNAQIAQQLAANTVIVDPCDSDCDSDLDSDDVPDVQPNNNTVPANESIADALLPPEVANTVAAPDVNEERRLSI